MSVRANAATTQDLQLQRGAEIGGTVRFDDGTSFAAASIGLERRDAAGKWVSPLNSSAAQTDADGRYRFTGLAPGEYRVGVNLAVQELNQSNLLGRGSMSSSLAYNLIVYSGDTTRKSDAKPRTLTDGERADGFDVTIPASKMHKLSGALVDVRTGQVVNAGMVRLLSGDDEIAFSTIDYDTGQFTFSFVPEGSYKLEATHAREIRIEAPANKPAFGVGGPGKEIVLQQYGSGELPVTLTGELQGVNIPVPAVPANPH